MENLLKESSFVILTKAHHLTLYHALASQNLLISTEISSHSHGPALKHQWYIYLTDINIIRFEVKGILQFLTPRIHL